MKRERGERLRQRERRGEIAVNNGGRQSDGVTKTEKGERNPIKVHFSPENVTT